MESVGRCQAEAEMRRDVRLLRCQGWVKVGGGERGKDIQLWKQLD